MLYPIVIEMPQREGEGHGVAVPDIPGCFSAGASLDEAIQEAREAIELHLEGLAEEGVDPPAAGDIGRYQRDPQYAGRVWAVVEIDVTRYMGKAEKINVTLPGNLIRRIDEAVKREPGESRSGFLARAALDRLQRVEH